VDSQDLRRRFKAACAAEGQTMTGILRAIIERYASTVEVEGEEKGKTDEIRNP